MRYGFDHVRASDEHVGRVFDHDVEVGNRRTVHRAARARAHDATDLRHHAAGQSVAQKNVGITAETDDAFLYARAAGIVQADDRGADLHRQVHYFANLFGVRFREGAAKDSKVLREDKDFAAIDQAVGGDDSVAGIDFFLHPKVARAMFDQLIEFLKRAVIEQELDALARSQLAGGVLL